VACFRGRQAIGFCSAGRGGSVGIGIMVLGVLSIVCA
jgi:hypothetical protein